MKMLVKYEIIKLFQRPTTKIVLVSSIIFSLVSLISGFLTFEIIDTDNKVRKGMDAIRYDKATQNQYEGKYTTDEVKQFEEEWEKLDAIDKDSEYRDQEEARYYKKYGTVPGILSFRQLILERIDDFENDEISGLGELVRDRKTSSLVDIIRKPNSKSEKLIAKKLATMYREIEFPYYFSYIEGWNKLIPGFSKILAFLIGPIIIICLSPIFSDEYHIKTAPIILTTKYGKNKLNKAKIITAFSFSTIIFLLFLLLYTVFYGLTKGLSGIDSSIQISPYFVFSPYNLTIGELFLRIIGIGYLGVLFLTSVTLFVSAKCKNAYTSIIVLASILYLPTIDISIISKSAQKIMILFPTNTLYVSKIYIETKIYSVFGFMVDQASIATIVSILLTLAFVYLSYKTFKSYQDKG